MTTIPNDIMVLWLPPRGGRPAVLACACEGDDEHTCGFTAERFRRYHPDLKGLFLLDGQTVHDFRPLTPDEAVGMIDGNLPAALGGGA